MLTRNHAAHLKIPNMKPSDRYHQEPVHVYCRLRPMANPGEEPCLRTISASTIQMTAPDTAVNYRDGQYKEIRYSFSYVFDQNASQKNVFEHVALPLVDGLVHGKNGLLFAYGITGSGKTFTMTGNAQNTGVLPRTLDVLFNTIGGIQAKKFVFKPDKLNGFEVQSEEDAKNDGLSELQAVASNVKTPRLARRQESEWAGRIVEKTKIEHINEDNMFAVFVTYTEIYNNSVYDLLDDNFEEIAKTRGPQSKMVREDGSKNMYVHGVTEVEVKSTDEAFEVFNRGLRRKRMASNTVNCESSRSHSVFTVRLVQAPLDENGESLLQDKRHIAISQLSFVDLAGSERSSRTNTCGERLREAGNINNSLMNLRTCLEILRENQLTNGCKLVPYRATKLTHLFKHYFEGSAAIRVIACVNPRSQDYDENVHVMKFAEVTQEVQVLRPVANLDNQHNLPQGRKKANEMFKKAMEELKNDHKNIANIPVNVGVSAVYRMAPHFPDLCLNGPEDDRLLKNLMLFLEEENAKKKSLVAEIETKTEAHIARMIDLEKELLTIKHQNSLLNCEKTDLMGKVDNLESKLMKSQVELNTVKKQSSGYERIIKRLQEEIDEKDRELNKRVQDRQRDKQRYQSKIAQTAEKMNLELEQKLTENKRKMEMEIRNKEKKLREVKRILSDEYLATPRSYDLPYSATTDSLATPSTITTRRKPMTATATTPMSTNRPQGRIGGGVAVSNRRHRRSRSVTDDRWLEHRPAAPVPLDTVMQPVLAKRKSVTKLTDVRDLADPRTNKYCLFTQEQDSEGDLETHVYKGDVVPTCGGGAQVILNDVEILKQKSPQCSPTRKRSGTTIANVEEKCSVAIEGHGKKTRRQ